MPNSNMIYGGINAGSAVTSGDMNYQPPPTDWLILEELRRTNAKLEALIQLLSPRNPLASGPWVGKNDIP